MSFELCVSWSGNKTSKGDDNVALLCRVLWEGKSEPLQPLDSGWFDDFSATINPNLLPIQSRYLNNCPTECFSQRHLVVKFYVCTVACEKWVRFVPDYERNVCWNLPGNFVSFLTESDFCSGFPASLDVYF